MSRKFVVVDTETTGNAPKKGDKIIQIGLAVIEDGSVTETFSSFIQPHRPIPAFIQQLTGIEQEDVQTAPEFLEIAPLLLEKLENAFFVAHNVRFDLHFINNELEEAGFPAFKGKVIDTVEFSRILYPRAPGYQLSQLAEWLQISHSRPHQADSDAQVTADLLLLLFDKFSQLPAPAWKGLRSLASHLESDILPLTKSWENNPAWSEKYDIVEYKGIALKRPERPAAGERTKKPEEGSGRFFSPGGLLSTVWKDFDYREGQEKMAEEVETAMENRRHLLVEAGTGIGKTLAYLVPSLYFSKHTGKRVIVSTHTITLQEQLIQKEIPLLKKAVPFSISVFLLKGKSHYLCLRKFKQMLGTAPASYEEVLGLAQILIWILETETGDVEEINLPGGANSLFWEKVCTDDSYGSRASGQWADYNFYERAKARAETADILITNHALLFTEMKRGDQLLPENKHVVIDEAHHLDDLASKHLGEEVSYFYFNQVLNRIGMLEEIGIFQRLLVFEQSSIGHFSSSWYQKREDYFTLLKYEIDELFRMIHHYCRKHSIPKRTDVGRLSLRYFPAQNADSEWTAVKDSLQRILYIFEEEERAWLSFYHQLSSVVPQGTNEEGLLHDFKSAAEDIEGMCLRLESLLLEEKDNYVYWMEIDKKGAANAAYLYNRPVDVSEQLADQFFARKDSVILTSAALTMKNSFSYVIRRWGLQDFGPKTLQLGSSFSIENRAKLMVPEDIRSIKQKEKDFIWDTAEFIYHAASITEGKMLVLFTSFEMLRQTYDQLKRWDEENIFTFIAQGVKSGSRSKLMKTFKQYEQAVLLGTNAFWEGIDIPGEDLSCLIIVRLPFPPPDEPITQARMEQVKQAGGNPFTEVSLPQAVLRFKQGFGRLLRHKNDRGVVIVLDKRIFQNRYGKDFIDSLPALPVLHKPVDHLLNEIALFFQKG
ncbi:ATP-dependent DNA helicase DinG [Salibacterium aidingense]|uniref:ATP-dependent DNA helicase DinG n=1 Tax=Salibacterium aidingense TaxID=384933 RepID=UPI003BE8CCFC